MYNQPNKYYTQQPSSKSTTVLAIDTLTRATKVSIPLRHRIPKIDHLQWEDLIDSLLDEPVGECTTSIQSLHNLLKLSPASKQILKVDCQEELSPVSGSEVAESVLEVAGGVGIESLGLDSGASVPSRLALGSWYERLLEALHGAIDPLLAEAVEVASSGCKLVAVLFSVADWVTIGAAAVLGLEAGAVEVARTAWSAADELTRSEDVAIWDRNWVGGDEASEGGGDGSEDSEKLHFDGLD